MPVERPLLTSAETPLSTGPFDSHKDYSEVVSYATGFIREIPKGIKEKSDLQFFNIGAGA